jgi:hypothetical protein
MAAGDEMAERTVPLRRRPWPVLPDHHPDPVVTAHASVRHGSDESIFERNVIRLGVDMGGVDAMMLSHGHWDHAGAMPRALQMMTLANGAL